MEELITQYVLFRLDSPTVADALAGRGSADEHTAELAAELAEDRETLDFLAEQFGTRTIDRRQWEKARKPVEARIASTERALARVTRTDALTGLATGDELRRRWAILNLDRQAAICRTLIGSVTIKPGVRGVRELDPDRAEVSWLL